MRLKARWLECEAWKQLSELQLVYDWADGIYVKAGLEKENAALLRDLKARGLKVPRLTIADGHLGIWSALSEIMPESQQQRCWVHYADLRIMPIKPTNIRREAVLATEMSVEYFSERCE